MSNNNNIIKTIKFIDFDPKKLKFTTFQDSKNNNKGIKIAFPSLEGDKIPYIQGPYFQLNDIGSGIPKLTEQSKQYFPTEKSRHFLKVPLEQDNEEHKIFTDIFREIDNYYSSNEFKRL